MSSPVTNWFANIIRAVYGYKGRTTHKTINKNMSMNHKAAYSASVKFSLYWKVREKTG